MATDAQGRATNRYRKEKVRQFNLKFFPADEDLYRWLAEQPRRNQYLKDLIRADMEGRVSMGDARRYVLASKNMGDIKFEVTGEQRDGTKDVEVTIVERGQSREWGEVDGGFVEGMFEWLMDRGVEFESDASLWFGVHYVASVMVDGDATKAALLDRAAGMTAEQLADWREATF